MLISIGSELRLVAIDTLHKYYDYRLPVGGGYWWTGELRKLALHSTQLKSALTGIASPDDIMKALPRLLTKADFPNPDPILKISLDGISKEVAQNCLGLASRLSGVKSASFSGFLHPGPFSKRIATACSRYLSICSPKFPADVGGALLALALYRENEERLHLGKPLETGDPPHKEWAPSPTVMRRLYRLKRPFEKYRDPTLSRDG